MKYKIVNPSGVVDVSLPIRGAWIEIGYKFFDIEPVLVAPHPGSVD